MQFVILIEAKDLDNLKWVYSRFFASLYSALNDK